MPENDDIILTRDNFKEIMSHMGTSKNIFFNSECVFIEYYDIIKSPWYVLLSVIAQNEKIKEILDLSQIEYLDSNGLYEWYVNRNNRNFLEDLHGKKYLPDLDTLLEVLMENKVFYETDTKLNTVRVVNTILEQKLTKELIIYTEKENQFVKDDIERLFPKKNIKYLYGEFREILKQIPSDTTYFLSDFNKVIDLSEENHLNFSSLVLPYDYSYNFYINEKNEKVPNIDFTYLGKDHIFKYTFFNACYV